MKLKIGSLRVYLGRVGRHDGRWMPHGHFLTWATRRHGRTVILSACAGEWHIQVGLWGYGAVEGAA